MKPSAKGPPLASQPADHRPWWVFASVVAAVLCTYATSLTGGFVIDDLVHVTPPTLRSPDGLRRIWFEPGATQQYYPVLHTVFWIQHRLWGDAAFGYRLANALLHATAACLLILALDRLKARGAALAGLLFAVHPVCVESVAWVSEQKNTLSLAFYLAAGLIYLRFDRERRSGAYAAASGLFVLAVLTKTVTVTLPAALLLSLWWQRGRLSLRWDVAPLLPWFVAGLAGGLFTAWFEVSVLHAGGGPFALTVVERCLLASRAIWFYLGKLVWPVDLMFNYPRWDVTASAPAWWGWTLATVAVTAALWIMRRRARGPLAAWLFFVGSLFPALGFFNVYAFVFSYVWDHFQYQAAIGIVAAAAAGWGTWLERERRPPARRLMFAGAAIVLVFLAVLSWRETAKYRDEPTLYRAILADNPDSFLAHTNLGTLLRLSGDRAGAIRHYREAIRANPDAVDALISLADVLAQQGELHEAIGLYQRALKFEQTAPVHAGLGAALLRAGRAQEAVQHLEEAVRLQPDQAGRHRMLGAAYLAAGRRQEALEHFHAAVSLAPRDAGQLNDIGSALAQAGLLAEALAHYENALRLEPALTKAHLNLALLLPRTNRLPEAIDHAREASRLAPDLVDAAAMLCDLLMTAGRSAEALDVCAATVPRAPADPLLRYGYGTALLLNGRAAEAEVQLREATRLAPDSADAHQNLALALEALGRRGEAAQEERRAAELRVGAGAAARRR